MRRVSPAVALPLFALVAGLAADGRARPLANDIPPRLQWNANRGYCGEVSFISAGLYFGQYLSQFDARRAAIGSTPQDRGELLLGLNDRRAADAMRLDLVPCPRPATRDPLRFLSWVKRQVQLGRPVIIGVYDNKFRFDGKTDPAAGDPQYDHIVPVVCFISRAPLAPGPVHPTDRIVFSDNGLWGNTRNRPYLFRPTVAQFPADRAQANAPTASLYSLPDYGRNYGVAIRGVADPDGVTRPIRVTTDKNFEAPAMRHKSNTRPPSMPLRLTVIVSDLTPGVTYHVFRYDRLDAIPRARFNARAAKAVERRVITPTTGTTYRFTLEIRSDEIAAFRCVPASAP